MSTLLHATVYDFTQFDEFTGTDCKLNGITNKIFADFSRHVMTYISRETIKRRGGFQLDTDLFHTILSYTSQWRSRQFAISRNYSIVHYTRTDFSRSAVPHHSSGTGFQRRTFIFLDSGTIPAPQPQQLLTHSALAGNLPCLLHCTYLVVTLLELL
jgi:hypothetical protein